MGGPDLVGRGDMHKLVALGWTTSGSNAHLVGAMMAENSVLACIKKIFIV